MGYNISGIIANKTIQNLNDSIQSLFDVKIECTEKTTLEDALETKFEDRQIDVYQSKQGVLILTNIDRLDTLKTQSFLHDNLIKFVISEVTGMYHFEVY